MLGIRLTLPRRNGPAMTSCWTDSHEIARHSTARWLSSAVTVCKRVTDNETISTDKLLRWTGVCVDSCSNPAAIDFQAIRINRHGRTHSLQAQQSHKVRAQPLHLSLPRPPDQTRGTREASVSDPKHEPSIRERAKMKLGSSMQQHSQASLMG